jgi:hypothetical protein
VSAISVYEVWNLSRLGARWITPGWVMLFEFGVLVAVTAAVAIGGRGRPTPEAGDGLDERFS